ncbi:MAG: glycosyltransferase family 4 protein [Candidatus Vogelbacteria bacterium]
MKLLILTQKVDRNDPILGFFHRWIEEFAKHCEKLTVICLQKGEYNLPSNVRVLSLGKPAQGWPASGGKKLFGKLRALFRFYRYIWRERKNYDAVFVHMNQEYVLLGWKFWKLWNKKIYLWRNHAKGNLWTRLAVLFSNKVFCTSPQSFTARFKKTKIMPVGIDTDFFRPDSNVKKIPRSILALGRISPIKRLDILINALLELQKQGETFTATIIGSPISDLDQQYEDNLHQLAKPLTGAHLLNFCPAVPHHQTPAIYQSHEIYVNLTPAGSFDKTILEAMMSGCLALAFNVNLSLQIGERLIIRELWVEKIANQVSDILSMSEQKKRELIQKEVIFAEIHSLTSLIIQLVNELKK